MKIGSETCCTIPSQSRLSQQFPDKRNCLRRIGPNRVVRAYIRPADDGAVIDDIASRHRQPPGTIGIESLQVEAESKVYLAHILRHFVDQTEFLGQRAARIAENFKGEVMLVDDVASKFFGLRCNGNERGSQRSEFAGCLLQSLQLQVAVWSPGSPVKRQHHGTLF